MSLLTRLASHELFRPKNKEVVPVNVSDELRHTFPEVSKRWGRYCSNSTVNFVAELLAYQIWNETVSNDPEWVARKEKSHARPAIELTNVHLVLFNRKKGKHGKYVTAYDRRRRPLIVDRVIFKNFAGTPGGLVISPDAYGLLLGIPHDNTYAPLAGTMFPETPTGLRNYVRLHGLCIERFMNEDDLKSNNPYALVPKIGNDMYADAESTDFYEKLDELMRKRFAHIQEQLPEGEYNNGLHVLHELLVEAGFKPAPFSVMSKHR